MERKQGIVAEAPHGAAWNRTRELVATGLILEATRRRAEAEVTGQAVTPSMPFESRMAEMRQRIIGPDRSNN